MKKQLLCLVICCISFSAIGQVKLPKLISDSMILQRGTPVTIWGWATEGEKVVVTFIGKKYAATTGQDKKWSIRIPSLKAGGPYNMWISSSNSIEIKNILVGDVWVCSGQSNMELSMERVKEVYADEVAKAGNTFIRQFNVSTRFDFHGPQNDYPFGGWSTVNPSSIFGFTAVGYFFAKELYEKYRVPIGLIKTAVGGSPAEAWLSEEALQQFPSYRDVMLRFRNDVYLDSIRQSDNASTNKWYGDLWLNDKGMQENPKWFDPNYNSNSWSSMKVPGYWHDQGLPRTNGIVWFRKEINLPDTAGNKPVMLKLGTIIDRDSVYVNGKFAGTTGYQYPPRRYTLPAGMLQPGKNIIAVKVINSGGRGGFYKDKPYYLILGNDSIDLSGDWQYQLSYAAKPISPTTTFHYQPGGLFNAMIAPILTSPVKGILWYQGESNTGRATEYQQLLTAMIKDWRKNWNSPHLPFLYVQLSNYMETKQIPVESNWAMLRESQRLTLKTPFTAMVVATDLGEWNDIHPLNKKDIGKRLALAARKIAYGEKKLVHSGPVYRSMTKKGNRVILEFDYTGSGLVKKGDQLNHFAIAGADGQYKWATAIIQGNKVIVWSDDIPQPVSVRYAWADNPEGANLYNKEGLPASPFQTNK